MKERKRLQYLEMPKGTYSGILSKTPSIIEKIFEAQYHLVYLLQLEYLSC